MMNNDYDIDWNKVNQMDEYILVSSIALSSLN